MRIVVCSFLEGFKTDFETQNPFRLGVKAKFSYRAKKSYGFSSEVFTDFSSPNSEVDKNFFARAAEGVALSSNEDNDVSIFDLEPKNLSP